MCIYIWHQYVYTRSILVKIDLYWSNKCLRKFLYPHESEEFFKSFLRVNKLLLYYDDDYSCEFLSKNVVE